jgi:hypothetical protein
VDNEEDAAENEELDDLQAELADCEALLEISPLAATRLGVEHATTKKRKAELEKAILKLDRKVGKAAVNAAQRELDKANYLELHMERGQIQKRGAEKARQTFVQLQEAQRRQVVYWQQQMQSTAEAELVRQQEWADRSQLLLERHQKVIAEFDKRTAAAKAKAPAATALNEVNVNKSLVTVRRQQQHSFFEEVASGFAPEKLTAISQEDLSNDKGVRACGNLHQLITQWMHAGAAVPFTFQQLAQESAVGSDVLELVSRLLGEQCSLWYQDGPAQVADIIPRQVVIALYGILEKAKLQFEGMEEAKQSATSCLAKLTEQHKKRRISSTEDADEML